MYVDAGPDACKDGGQNQGEAPYRGSGTPSTGTPITSTRNPSGSRRDHKEDCKGRVARGGGEVTTVIANLTVGPDDCGGWAIYIGWGGASS